LAAKIAAAIKKASAGSGAPTVSSAMKAATSQTTCADMNCVSSPPIAPRRRLECPPDLPILARQLHRNDESALLGGASEKPVNVVFAARSEGPPTRQGGAAASTRRMTGRPCPAIQRPHCRAPRRRFLAAVAG